MSEYQIQTIEDEAKKSRKHLCATQKKEKKEVMTISIDNMIAYCDKVMFLCREIRKLRHE